MHYNVFRKAFVCILSYFVNTIRQSVPARHIILNIDKDMATNVDSGQRFQALHSPLHLIYSFFTIKTAVYGDVNGDSSVDVADIATIISEMAARARLEIENWR